MARLLLQSIVLVSVTVVLSQNLEYGELRRLYNTRVVSAQKYVRPLGSSGSVSGLRGLSTFIPHAGVVVTTEDGGRWLVHKGNGYGDASETVVTRASYMSRDWSPRGQRKRILWSKVADYVSAGGRDYSLLGSNCLHAAGRMMRLN